MDMHIHMGYCTAESFRILTRNYHSVENHAMCPEIEQLIEEVMVSPAEVAEVLMRNENSDVVLQDLLQGHVKHISLQLYFHLTSFL